MSKSAFIKSFAVSAAITWAPAAHSFDLATLRISEGNITSRHHQTGPQDFNEKHKLWLADISSKNADRFLLMSLKPNSFGRNTIGIGRMSQPLTWRFNKHVELNVTGAAGIATGYIKNAPAPMVAGLIHLSLYQDKKWQLGLGTAVVPYIAKNPDNKYRAGIVTTSPYLSITRKF